MWIHPLITPIVHPRRRALGWLAAGPVIAIMLYGLFHQSLLFSVLVALGAGVLFVLLFGGFLIWDMAMAALGMAALYTLFYLLLGQFMQGYSIAFGGGVFSGVLVFGHPIEEVVLVGLYGALWGPILSAFRSSTTQDIPFAKQHVIPKQVTVGLAALAIIIGSALINTQFVRMPKVVAASPAAGELLNGLESPITLTFDRPLARSGLTVTLSPSVDGDISFADSVGERYFVQQVVFTPRHYLEPDTAYTLQVNNLGNILGKKDGSYAHTFRTPALPTVKAASITEAQTSVGACEPFTVTLNQPTHNLADFSFALTPPIPLKVEPTADESGYTLKPETCLAQGTAYALTVSRQLTLYNSDNNLTQTGDPTTVYLANFTTKAAPGITSVTPQGSGIVPDVKTMTIVFTEPMKQDAPGDKITIVPALSGSWSWKDATTLIYTFSEKPAFATTYKMTIAQGLPDAAGGSLAQNAEFSFTTIGPVRVSGLTPANGSAGVSVNAPIRVTFDQPVDHTSAEAAFSIAPSVGGTFSWSGETMTYAQTGFAKDTSYKVTMAAGVKSTIGQPSTTAASSTFQTEQSSVQFAIPVYYQQRPLSCEMAALKMALGYRGTSVTEDHLLSILGADTRPRDGGTWGDPNLTFVGDVNGHQNTTGYGTHALPTERVAETYRSAETFSGWSMAQIAHSLADGNPIVFWGTAGRARRDPWTSFGGSAVNGWVGEHVRLLIGFTGSADNPSKFIINDPIFGRLTWTAAQLQSNMSAFGSMGVVIF
jgi:uncharacterized protein YvpB